MECHYCGRRFPELYKLTPEDIQREHLPPIAFQMACADCLGKIRSAAYLLPEYSLKQTVRDFSFMVPAFSGSLFITAVGVSMLAVKGIAGVGSASQWLGIATVMVGTLMLWDRFKRRYGFTHDLHWSLNSRRISLVFAIMLAGMIIAIVSTQLPR